MLKSVLDNYSGVLNVNKVTYIIKFANCCCFHSAQNVTKIKLIAASKCNVLLAVLQVQCTVILLKCPRTRKTQR